MKTEELREKTDAELMTLEKEIRGELFGLRMKHYMGQLQNVSDLKSKKRAIARIKTVLRQKEIAATEG